MRQNYDKLLTNLARIVGAAFVVVGVVFTIWGIGLLVDSSATLDANGVATRDPYIKSTVLIVGVLVGTLGVLVLVAQPYQRPK